MEKLERITDETSVRKKEERDEKRRNDRMYQVVVK